MGRFTIRRGLTLAAALLAGGALALPFASPASSSAPAPDSGGATGGAMTTGTTGTGTTGTTTTGTTETTPTGTTTTTTGTTSTTPATTPMGTTSTAPKPAPPPPRVGTTSVERVASTSAVVKTGIDPEGLATTYRVQYGPTPAYGSQSGSATAGSGSAEIKLTHGIGGLTPNTTYHFRVAASSSAGATIGADGTFTTAKQPPTLSASVATGQVAFGRPLTLSGTATGPDSAGVEVVVQENPYPYNRGFQDVTSPEPVVGTGEFSFVLPGLFESAQLRVATAGAPLAYSPAVGEAVTVRVTLQARRARRPGYVRLYGMVTPSEPGASVAFERWQHGRYTAVGGTRVEGPAGASSRFARVIRLRRGRYRALVKVAAGPLGSGRSAAVTVHRR
jgi:hypothetical protein